MYHQPGTPANGPPPICFNCSKEGHFVVDCPESNRKNIGGPPLLQNVPNGNYPGTQPRRWSSSQNMGASGATVTHFPKPPPVVTRYATPNQPSQYSISPGPYGPSPTAPPYQHPGSATPVQMYPPPQGSYLPQQYGPSAPPLYSHNPPPQSYSAPLPNSQYSQGYQPPPPNQYTPPAAPPQYNAPTAQHYGLPPAAQYQMPIKQYPPQSTIHSGPPPTQWNNSTPVPASSPYSAPPQQQLSQERRSSSIQREYSGTPNQQPTSQPQCQQIPQNEPGQVSDGYQQTPKIPTPSFNPSDSMQISQGSPANDSYFLKSASESIVSSRASTPYGRYGSVSSDSGKQRPPSASSKSRSATPFVNVPEPISLAEEAALKGPTEANKDASRKDEEEGEYTEEDLLQEQFNWEYKKIFKEATPTENVALSQPLSYTYNVTPVPLMDARWTGSVSRYARKENLKEYMRPIRSQPQWDYLKEDPAFSDNKLEGPLIPLGEIRSWMEERHRVEEIEEISEVTEDREASASSRKRGWSGEQDDIHNQVPLDSSVEQSQRSPNKRRKNGDSGEDSCIAFDAPRVSGPATPTIGRAGTPSFGVVDDAWAPEPGEAASAPMDPTEALLASLGVSGNPKPVREQSNPPTLIPAEEHYVTSPYASMPENMSPQANQSQNGTPHNNSNQNLPPQGSQESPQRPRHNNSGYGNTQYQTPQQGSPTNENVYGPSITSATYSNHGMPSYNSNMSPQANSGYGPPQQYSNPPPPQRQPLYENNQYGSPQGQYQPQSHYSPPQNQYPPQGQYSGPSNSQYGPPQVQYNGPPQAQYNGPPQNNYGPSQTQYGSSQPYYNGPPQTQYGPPQGQYGAPTQGQYGSPQGQSGPPPGHYHPPQAQYNNGYPSGPPSQGFPQYGNPPYGPPHQSQPPQGNPQWANVPQEANPPYHPFFNQAHSNQPPRQDSGYVSARGSYSNGSAPNVFSNGTATQQALQHTKNSSNLRGDGANYTPSPDNPLEKKESEISLESEEHKAIEPIESPLSPTSQEILGKLTQPAKPRKIIRVISGKNKDSSRQADESPAKKLKRPAPLVAEAYSRRW